MLERRHRGEKNPNIIRFRELLKQMNYILLEPLGTLTVNTKVTVQCNHGHVYTSIVHHIVKGTTCTVCKWPLSAQHLHQKRDFIIPPRTFILHTDEITPAQACKMVQCDPSVNWFQTKIACKLREDFDQAEIITWIRDVNKRLYKFHHTAATHIIVATAIRIYTLKHSLKSTFSYPATLCQTTEVSIREMLYKLRYKKGWQIYEMMKEKRV